MGVPALNQRLQRPRRALARGGAVQAAPATTLLLKHNLFISIGPWGGLVAGRPRRRRRPSRRTYLAPTHPAVIEKGSPRFTPARRPRSPMFRRRLRTRRQSGREHRTRPPGARGRHSRPPKPAHRRAGGTFRPTRAGHAGTLYANWLLEPETSDELVEDINMHTLPLRGLRGDPERPDGAGDLASRRCDRRPRHDRRGAAAGRRTVTGGQCSSICESRALAQRTMAVRRRQRRAARRGSGARGASPTVKSRRDAPGPGVGRVSETPAAEPPP